MSQAIPDYRKLSIAERIQLVEDIWDSIAQESPESMALSAEQQAEIRRRLVDYEADPSSAIPWPQVREELFGRDT